MLAKRRTTRARAKHTGDRGLSQKNSMFFNFFIKLALHEVGVLQWSAENGDALLEGGKTVVSAICTTRLTICIEEKVLAIRRCLSGPVPKLVLQRLLDSGDSCWD